MVVSFQTAKLQMLCSQLCYCCWCVFVCVSFFSLRTFGGVFFRCLYFNWRYCRGRVHSLIPSRDFICILIFIATFLFRCCVISSAKYQWTKIGEQILFRTTYFFNWLNLESIESQTLCVRCRVHTEN